MKTILAILVVLMASTSLCFGGLINGGFESGMTGWTSVYENDGTNFGYNNLLYVTNNYHHSGDWALYGQAHIVGDESAWQEEDWARTYAWSSPTDLTSVDSIQLSLTDFQSNTDYFSWGWGQEVFLVLSDGTNTVKTILVENHEHPWAIPQPSTTSIGSDGRTWFDFDIPLTSTAFGVGIDSLNKSSAMVGICWEALNWNQYSQTLWASAVVDDIRLVPDVPEPSTIVLLTGLISSLLLLYRRK